MRSMLFNANIEPQLRLRQIWLMACSETNVGHIFRCNVYVFVYRLRNAFTTYECAPGGFPAGWLEIIVVFISDRKKEPELGIGHAHSNGPPKWLRQNSYTHTNLALKLPTDLAPTVGRWIQCQFGWRTFSTLPRAKVYPSSACIWCVLDKRKMFTFITAQKEVMLLREGR